MAPPVAGYVAWWDASQITGSADNSSLTTWTDLSGNSRTLTFGVGTAPIYYSSTVGKTVNGLPAVWFSGGGLATASWTLAQPFTVVAVARLTGSPSGLAIFGSASAGLLMWANTNWQLYAGSIFDAGVAVDASLHAVAGVFNGASSAMDIDGTAHTGNPSTQGLSGSANVGVGQGTSYEWVGPICEVIVYPSALSTGNRASLYTYLYNKWVSSPVTASLPLGPLTVAATGTISGGTVTGTVALSLGPVTLAATGTVLALATGTATLTLGPLTLFSLTSDLISIGPLTLTVAGTVAIPAPPYVRIAAFDRPATSTATGDR